MSIVVNGKLTKTLIRCSWIYAQSLLVLHELPTQILLGFKLVPQIGHVTQQKSTWFESDLMHRYTADNGPFLPGNIFKLNSTFAKQELE